MDGSLLDYVQEMTYALEVSMRSRDEWAHAIHTGLRCLDAVWENNGGVLLGDLTTRSLTYQSPLNCRAPAPSVRAADPTLAGSDNRAASASGGTPA